MLKQCKVVMLPNNQQTKYLMVYSDVEKTKGKLILNGLKNDEYKEYQHLYIISDDEIKEDDWVYENNLNQETQIYQVYNRNNELGFFRFRNVWIPLNKQNLAKKIIATTDTSLKIPRKDSHPNSIWKLDGALLPQPSQQFIEKYIEEYNKGQQITECLVEYEDIYPEHFTYNPSENIITRLKVDKNNTITIKKVKDSWNREEVIKLLESMPNFFNNSISKQIELRTRLIEENL